MKLCTKNLSALLAVFWLIVVAEATAQTCTNLHNFNGNDGANPEAGLILSGNTLYGTTSAGGSFSNGTIFAIHTDGTCFTNLHIFTAVVQVYEGSFPMPGSSLPLPVYEYTNGDGANPQAGLILSGTTLYGTASEGGSSGNGTVFAIHTDGTGFTNLYSFTGYNPSVYLNTNIDGANPTAGLILSGNTLYGTASAGGHSGNGTVFAIHSDGTGFKNLHTFSGLFSGFNPFALNPTNGDGASPVDSLILSGNTLYGTASSGGSSGVGTIFTVNTNGTLFTNLYAFTGSNDGGDPRASLILLGNTLYGTTRNGGSGGNGTVFAVNTNGAGFTNLYSFTVYETLDNHPNSESPI